MPLRLSSTPPPLSSETPEKEAVPMIPGTLFPHVLIDEVLPFLSGSEWQLLTVIVRQTWGWHDPTTGARKRSDWLSHRQLKARTGRGSEAVSHAVDGLVRKELIEVRDESGRLMATAEERRRSCSRLFYSLAPQLVASFGVIRQSEQFAGSVPVPRTGKAETTKENGTNSLTKAFRKPERTSYPDLISTVTPTPAISQPIRSNEDGCDCLRPLLSPSLPKPMSAQVHSDIVRRFLTTFQEHGGHDANSIPVLEADDTVKLQIALERFGFERLAHLLELFFRSDLAYVVRHGHSLPVFLSVTHILNAQRIKKARP